MSKNIKVPRDARNTTKHVKNVVKNVLGSCQKSILIPETVEDSLNGK